MAGQRQNTERHHHCVLLEAARESPCTYQVSITILDRITLHGHRFGFKPFCHAKKEATAAKTVTGENRCKLLFSGRIFEAGVAVRVEHSTWLHWVNPVTTANAQCSSSAYEHMNLEEKKKEEGWCVHWQVSKYQPNAPAYPGWRHGRVNVDGANGQAQNHYFLKHRTLDVNDAAFVPKQKRFSSSV